MTGGRLRMTKAVSAMLCLAVLWAWAGGLARAAGPTEQISLAFVGDVMIGRWIGEQLDRHGEGYALGPVVPLLRAADLTFGNLESPLTTAPYLQQGYNLVGSPAHVTNLRQAGFDIMSLANNHLTDHGPEGLAETMGALDEMGIAHVGAGADISEARQAWIGEVGSLKVAYLAYDNTWGSTPATEDRAGSAHFDDQVAVDVAQARQVADLVVVSMHWGLEYYDLPNKRQQGHANTLAQAGADIVVGHHPHVVQPLEWITVPGRERPTLVVYSLGNFIFDQEFSAKTSESAILWCGATAEGVSYARLIPSHIRRGQVAPVNSLVGEEVLLRLLPREKEKAPLQAFSVATLPNGERDFQIVWSLAPALDELLPSITDMDGDGAAEEVNQLGYKLCVQPTTSGSEWCTPPQWQVGSGLLEDVDGDGVAELVVRAQQNEEVAPAWGEFVQVWKWQDGEFRLTWRSIPGDYRELWTTDVDGDGIRDIAVGQRG